MKKEYWLILITYIAMQLSSFIGVPITVYLGTVFGKTFTEMKSLSIPIWLVISFVSGLAITLWLLRKEANERDIKPKANYFDSIIWGIAGVFLALFAQGLAANIEIMLGIEIGSENTQRIIRLIDTFPIVILVSSIVGPILEEIVFRKVIFGSLHKRFNFFVSALISSIIFALAHMEFEHIILYSAMGFTFSYLYVKTNRIIVPIIAHISMNTFVVLVQSIFKDDIERLIRILIEMKKLQGFIGGF